MKYGCRAVHFRESLKYFLAVTLYAEIWPYQMMNVPKMGECLFTFFSEVQLSWSRFARNSELLKITVCRSLLPNFIKICQKRAKLGIKSLSPYVQCDCT